MFSNVMLQHCPCSLAPTSAELFYSLTPMSPMISKDQSIYFLDYDDARRHFFQLPHDTTPASFLTSLRRLRIRKPIFIGCEQPPSYPMTLSVTKPFCAGQYLTNFNLQSYRTHPAYNWSSYLSKTNARQRGTHPRSQKAALWEIWSANRLVSMNVCL